MPIITPILVNVGIIVEMGATWSKKEGKCQKMQRNCYLIPN